jgi:hypothetical protein
MSHKLNKPCSHFKWRVCSCSSKTHPASQARLFVLKLTTHFVVIIRVLLINNCDYVGLARRIYSYVRCVAAINACMEHFCRAVYSSCDVCDVSPGTPHTLELPPLRCGLMHVLLPPTSNIAAQVAQLAHSLIDVAIKVDDQVACSVGAVSAYLDAELGFTNCTDGGPIVPEDECLQAAVLLPRSTYKDRGVSHLNSRGTPAASILGCSSVRIPFCLLNARAVSPLQSTVL